MMKTLASNLKAAQTRVEIDNQNDLDFRGVLSKSSDLRQQKAAATELKKTERQAADMVPRWVADQSQGLLQTSGELRDRHDELQTRIAALKDIARRNHQATSEIDSLVSSFEDVVQQWEIADGRVIPSLFWDSIPWRAQKPMLRVNAHIDNLTAMLNDRAQLKKRVAAESTALLGGIPDEALNQLEPLSLLAPPADWPRLRSDCAAAVKPLSALRVQLATEMKDTELVIAETQAELGVIDRALRNAVIEQLPVGLRRFAGLPRDQAT